MSEPRWILWRQDDNGSAVVIDAFASEDAADGMRADLEARGHKQHYWIEEEKTGGDKRRPTHASSV